MHVLYTFTGGDYFDCGRTGQNCNNDGKCNTDSCECASEYDGYNCDVKKSRYILYHIASPYRSYNCQIRDSNCTIAIWRLELFNIRE